jgi:hypothetical protein
MAPPSQITIATSSLKRLVKEEASYHKELKSQEERLEKLLARTDEDENAEYQLKQEVYSPFLLKYCRPKYRERHLIYCSGPLSTKLEQSSHLSANASPMPSSSLKISLSPGMRQRRRLRRLMQ